MADPSTDPLTAGIGELTLEDPDDPGVADVPTDLNEVEPESAAGVANDPPVDLASGEDALAQQSGGPANPAIQNPDGDDDADATGFRTAFAIKARQYEARWRQHINRYLQAAGTDLHQNLIAKPDERKNWIDQRLRTYVDAYRTALKEELHNFANIIFVQRFAEAVQHIDQGNVEQIAELQAQLQETRASLETATTAKIQADNRTAQLSAEATAQVGDGAAAIQDLQGRLDACQQENAQLQQTLSQAQFQIQAQVQQAQQPVPVDDQMGEAPEGEVLPMSDVAGEVAPGVAQPPAPVAEPAQPAAEPAQPATFPGLPVPDETQMTGGAIPQGTFAQRRGTEAQQAAARIEEGEIAEQDEAEQIERQQQEAEQKAIQEGDITAREELDDVMADLRQQKINLRQQEINKAIDDLPDYTDEDEQLLIARMLAFDGEVQQKTPRTGAESKKGDISLLRQDQEIEHKRPRTEAENKEGDAGLLGQDRDELIAEAKRDIEKARESLERHEAKMTEEQKAERAAAMQARADELAFGNAAFAAALQAEMQFQEYDVSADIPELEAQAQTYFADRPTAKMPIVEIAKQYAGEPEKDLSNDDKKQLRQIIMQHMTEQEHKELFDIASLLVQEEQKKEPEYDVAKELSEGEISELVEGEGKEEFDVAEELSAEEIDKLVEGKAEDIVEAQVEAVVRRRRVAPIQMDPEPEEDDPLEAAIDESDETGGAVAQVSPEDVPSEFEQKGATPGQAKEAQLLADIEERIQAETGSEIPGDSPELREQYDQIATDLAARVSEQRTSQLGGKEEMSGPQVTKLRTEFWNKGQQVLERYYGEAIPTGLLASLNEMVEAEDQDQLIDDLTTFVHDILVAGHSLPEETRLSADQLSILFESTQAQPFMRKEKRSAIQREEQEEGEEEGPTKPRRRVRAKTAGSESASSSTSAAAPKAPPPKVPEKPPPPKGRKGKPKKGESGAAARSKPKKEPKKPATKGVGKKEAKSPKPIRKKKK